MSTDNPIGVCPKLPEAASLHIDSTPLATIEPEPLYPNPLTLDEIRFSSRLPTGPLYLDHIAERSCVYRVRPSEGEHEDPLAPHRFIEDRFLGDVLPYFGIPTHLRTASASPELHGAIYDGRRDHFYGAELGSSRWYLIGDAVNYSGYIRSVAQFAGDLRELWQENPLSFFRQALETYLAPPQESRPIPSPFQGRREIERFQRWLGDFDPDLAKAVSRRLRYSESSAFTLMEMAVCGARHDDSTYAYWESEWGEIHLLPRTIELLRRREYAAVAEILSHELAHQWTSQSGLVRPTIQLFHHGVAHFIAGQSLESPWQELFFKVFQAPLVVALQCRFLSQVPEEEAQAYSRNFVYSMEKLGAERGVVLPTALASYDLLWREAQENFPIDWQRLSFQYFLLAWELQRPLGRAETHEGWLGLFKADLQSRLDCARDEAQHCQDSEALRILRELASGRTGLGIK